MTVRLVKGAYWDYETILSRQRHWPVPVFAHKAESDANFEDLSRLLLENDDAVNTALGTHNVRSIAYALAQAERLGLDRRNIEFQMLYGMAEPIKTALLRMGCRLREYCPVGELLPGIAYFVRRLLRTPPTKGSWPTNLPRAPAVKNCSKTLAKCFPRPAFDPPAPGG